MTEEKKLDKCPKCGGNNFRVVEWETYAGEFVDGKLIYSTLKDNGIESVTCHDCGEVLDDSEIELEFVG
jgi:predicted  nucleic acid-binding Zn-ribbon protein